VNILTHSIGFIYAHPDDETFLSGCLVRQLADEGARPVLLLATKGDAGWKNGPVAHLSREQLAELRVQEMEQAAEILGVSLTEHLGHPDGRLNTVDEDTAVNEIAEFINRHRLQVVFTFPPDGGNSHPDHIAISQLTTAAVLSGKCPTVQKLYYALSNTLLQQGHPVSIQIDTKPGWAVKAEALRKHASQILAIERYFGDLSECPENRRFEAFVLGWERGSLWPGRQESSVWDGLI
jgi:LmbE family N-acetylglucosaminyl deacetylase